MRILKKILGISAKSIAVITIIAMIAITATSISPIYNFEEPTPFTGPDIFNPYKNIDKAADVATDADCRLWKKANFHVHTRVKGILNECDYWPGEVHERLEKLGYDIVTFSNHNELTTHPFDSTLQVNVYEHGYNIFKFHKLVFGSKEVNRFDHLLPISASQKQFQFDMLGKESDIIQYNHPLRTTGTSKSHMEKLGGYDIMELDCGKSTENEFWDWALSAGHYCFGLANDDLHYPDRTSKTARRCNFLYTPSARYDDIRECLLGGCYYSMRIPDYGNGDWEEKTRRNLSLPYIKKIGLKDSTIYMILSATADSIKVFGQGHATLLLSRDTAFAEYTMQPDDHYARFTAYLPGGEVIYSNPFARYDASIADSPAKHTAHSINITLTILFNTALLALTALLVFLLVKVVKFRV